ncbi:NmrA/HSCARG family protein [Pseudoroseomonas wenyumeiae]
MKTDKRPILVFGATGQQGGSVTAALLKAGWQVRALVREPAGRKSEALADAGVELVRGNFNDVASIRSAMIGASGVFSVQPFSGQGALYGVTDEDEVRFGMTVADLAVECGIGHLVYSSVSLAGDEPTGMGHFDSKLRIEEHIRTLSIAATIVRPATFMEMLVMPGFGLDTGHFNFLTRPDQLVQLLAVDDIGEFVAPIFADPARFAGETVQLASDTVTGSDIAAAFTQAAGRPISYSRFNDTVLGANSFLAKLAELMDQGVLTGRADLEGLRKLHPRMHTIHSWLAGSGRAALEQALRTAGEWEYGHA